MNKQEYGKVEIELTPEKQEKVFNLLMEFFNEYELYSGESLCQDDNGTIYSSEVMGDIADVLFEDVEIDW